LGKKHFVCKIEGKKTAVLCVFCQKNKKYPHKYTHTQKESLDEVHEVGESGGRSEVGELAGAVLVQ